MPVQPALRPCDRSGGGCGSRIAFLARWRRSLPLSARRRDPGHAHRRRSRARRTGGDVTVLVEARGLERSYDLGRGLFRKPLTLRAVGGVSFDIVDGRTLAVVGESG